VQPCGEPCGSAGGFDDGSYLNRKEITPPSRPEYMPVVSTMFYGWEVQFLHLLGGSRTKTNTSRTKNIQLLLLLNRRT
jgi:hypothetical protein